MFKGNIFTYLFLALGVGFVTVAYLLTNSYQKKLPSQKTIATIEKLTGEAFVTKKFKLKRKPVTDKANLNSLDTVETSENSKAEVEFPTGEKIRLLDNSKVLIDEENDNVQLILHRGDIEIQNYGSNDRIAVSYQGLKVQLREWEAYKKNKVLSYEDQKKTLNTFQSDQKLSENYVADLIQTHRQKFLQCYNKLLQKNPGITGSVTMSFTIEKSGKISNPNVASSQFTDVEFKSCLFEVLKRIEFKAFEGEPISTVIPLNFE
jgi:hypothetical protein